MKKVKANFYYLMLLLILPFLLCNSNLFSQQSDFLDKVRENDIEAVKILLASGTDVNMEDELTYLTPLNTAINNNLPEMIDLLIQSGADLNHSDFRSGYTPLMMALNDNKPELAKLLIREGADVKIKAKDGTTALLIAAGKSREMFDLLLAKGADLNAKNDRGVGVITNCFMGVMSDNLPPDFIEHLLSLGANIDEENTFGSYAGYTPLFWAVLYDEEKLVEFLLKKGADPAHTAKNGKTPLSIAKENGNEKIIQILENSK